MMKKPRIFTLWGNRFSALAAALMLASCGSTGGGDEAKQEAEIEQPNHLERSLDQRVKKWNVTARSSFEKGDNGSRDNRYFQQSGYKKNEYRGNTKYKSKSDKFKSGKEGFRTKEFAQGNQENRMSQQGFRGAKDRNRMGEQNFKTTESRFSNQQMRDGNKTSRMDGEQFRVPVDHQTSKAMERSKRPHIIESRGPDYTESEIGGFLNRN